MRKRFDARWPQAKAVRAVRMPAKSRPSYELATWLRSEGSKLSAKALATHGISTRAQVRLWLCNCVSVFTFSQNLSAARLGCQWLWLAAS